MTRPDEHETTSVRVGRYAQYSRGYDYREARPLYEGDQFYESDEPGVWRPLAEDEAREAVTRMADLFVRSPHDDVYRESLIVALERLDALRATPQDENAERPQQPPEPLATQNESKA